MADIFISYSSHDHEKATKLTDRLRGLGFTVWIDEANISAATQWSSEIVRAIEDCKVFIILLSHHSVASHNVIKELSLASEEKKHIIPVELEDFDLVHDVKYQLAGIQRVSFKYLDRIEEAVTRFLGSQPASDENAVTAHTTAHKRKKWLIPALSILVLLLGGGAYMLFHPSQTTGVEKITALKIKKIVVLPFESLSANKEDEFFADGLTAQVINSLSSLAGFQVTDRKTSMEYKGKRSDIKTIAKELGVRFVVDGTVQKAGKSVKITAELIDAETGKTMISDNFEGTTDDLFALQEKLARSVVFELQGTLGQQQLLDSTLVRQSTKNPEAYAKFIDGVGYLENVTSVEQLNKGMKYLDEAVALDPKFAYAQFLRGGGYLVRSTIDTVQANIQHDLVIADSLLRLAIALNPSYPEAYFLLAQVCVEQGNVDEAIAQVKRFMDQRPDNTSAYAFLGNLYYERGDFALAAEYLQHGVEKNITNLSSWSVLIDCFNALGDTSKRNKYIDESEPLYQLYLEKYPTNTAVRMQYALNLANRNKKDEAHHQVEQVLRSGAASPVDYYNIACTYSRLNEPQPAIESLKKSFEKGYNPGAKLNTDPDFQNIRKLPEFQALVKQMIGAKATLYPTARSVK